MKWTLIDLAGNNDPDTGDIYSGLDRFGRVKDNRWYDDGAAADADRIQYGYDRASDRHWRNAWDHRNRLMKVTFKNSSGVKTKEVEYVYDVNDRRIGKLLDSDGDGTVDDQWRFVYDPTTKGNLADVVLMFDGSGNLRHRYLHGPDVDQVLAGENSSGDILWPLADHLGTIRDLAEYDAQGDSTSVVNHLKYDAFGRITGQSNAGLTPLFTFTGREWDTDAALFYYRARWYDATVGRFLTEDPIGFDDDDNLYRYVLNSPVMVVDPTGEGTVVAGALAGCLQAAGLSAVTSWFSGDDFCTACCKGLVSCGFGAIGGAIAGALATSPNPRLPACAYSAGQGAAAGAAKGICTWACGRGGGDADITCGIIAGIANALLGCWLGSRVDAKTRKEAEVAINKALAPIVLQITGYDISKACKIFAA